MPATLIISPCGCAQVYLQDQGLLVVDSNKLGNKKFRVVRLDLGEQSYPVNRSFADLNQLLYFLNEELAITIGLYGLFSLTDGQIFYSNVEGFPTAEIVAIIFQNCVEYFVYAVGNAPTLQDGRIPDGYFDNGTRFLIPALINTELVVNDGAIHILPEQGGYSFDPSTGTITFDYEVTDRNIYIEAEFNDNLAQPQTFTFTFPFLLS